MQALAFSGGKDSMACLHLMRDTLDCAIYVDTGYAYPETLEVVDYAKTILPVHVVLSDKKAQNTREGIPADVVPVDWTPLGQQFTERKPIAVQSYLGCCYENIAVPLFKKAQELGVTELVYGQRNQENHKAPSRNGDVLFGIKRLHPIEDWSSADVMAYLSTKMEVPEHFVIKHSSLDCYDCTAYRKDSEDRVKWMEAKHPALFAQYRERSAALESALATAL